MVIVILVLIGFLALCAMAYGALAVFDSYGGVVMFGVGGGVLLAVIVFGISRWLYGA